MTPVALPCAPQALTPASKPHAHIHVELERLLCGHPTVDVELPADLAALWSVAALTDGLTREEWLRRVIAADFAGRA